MTPISCLESSTEKDERKIRAFKMSEDKILDQRMPVLHSAIILISER